MRLFTSKSCDIPLPFDAGRPASHRPEVQIALDFDPTVCAELSRVRSPSILPQRPDRLIGSDR